MKKKKKSQSKGLIFLLIVLVLLLAVYIVLDRQEKNQEAESEEQETESTLPVSVTEDELAKVTVKNQEQTMTFVKSDDTWTYEEDPEFPLDESTLTTKLEKLTTLSVDRTLESPEDLSEYGLDDPSIQITVEKTDGTAFTLYIGDKNDSTSDYYMKVDDGADVYTIGSSIPSAFDVTPYDMAVSESFPEIESANIKSLSVEKDGETTSFSSDEETGLVWTMYAPDGTENTVNTSALDTLKTSAASLSYNGFVDYKGEDLSQYGLDDPSAVITIVTEETETIEAEEETAEETSEAAESENETDEETGEAPEAESESTEEVSEAAEEISEASEAESESTEEMSGALEAESKTAEEVSEASESESEAAETESESETEPETEIITVTKTNTLLVGDADEDGNYYVQLQGSNEVHTMAESTLETLLSINKTDYVSQYLNDVPMTNLQSLKVTYQGENKELTVETEEVPVETETETEEETEEATIGIENPFSEETEGLSEEEAETETETESETEPQTETVYHYLVDGEESDETAFRTFYNNAVALQAQRRMDESEEPDVSGEPDITLEFTKQDGTTLKTEYYLGTDGLYTVLSDSALPAKISKLEVQKIIGYYEELINPEPETEIETETETAE